MKRIGVVVPEFPVLSETFVRTEMKGLEAAGHRVTPLTFKRRPELEDASCKYWASRAVDMSSVSVMAVLAFLFLYPWRLAQAWAFCRHQTGIRPRSLLWNSLKLAVLIKRFDLKHLHAHFSLHTTAHAITAAKLVGTTVSFICHGHDVYKQPCDLPVKLKHADFSVAVCKDMAERLHQQQASDIRLLHCGVDSKYLIEKKRPNYEAKRLIFVGRLVECKGLDKLLHAWSEVLADKHYVLDIVGDGELKEALIIWSRRLGLEGQVNFLGPKSHNWLRANVHYYSAMVAPFQIGADGTRDTGPLVLKEAMALALPVITTNLPGCLEIVDDRCALMCQHGDAYALTQALNRFALLSPKQRELLGKNGRRRVQQRFHGDKQAQHLSNWIQAL